MASLDSDKSFTDPEIDRGGPRKILRADHVQAEGVRGHGEDGGLREDDGGGRRADAHGARADKGAEGRADRCGQLGAH